MVKFCCLKSRSLRAPHHRKRDQKQGLSADDTTKQLPPAYAFKLMFIEICFDALGRKISAKWEFYYRKAGAGTFSEIKLSHEGLNKQILIEKICKLRYGKHRFIILSFEMNIPV